MCPVNTYRQGEHICALYTTQDEQRAIAAEYLADGLRKNERALYVTDTSEALLQFNDALSRRGVDVGAALDNGALVEQTHAEAHLVGGYFDSERMLRALNDGVEAALNAGFAGLRTCGDMSWLLGEPTGAEQVVEYEAHLNKFFHRSRACGMCQYDRMRLPAALIDYGLTTHVSAFIDGYHTANRFYLPPPVATTRRPQPDDLHWKISQLRRR